MHGILSSLLDRNIKTPVIHFNELKDFCDFITTPMNVTTPAHLQFLHLHHPNNILQQNSKSSVLKDLNKNAPFLK
jgi:hypothetical protein